MYSTTCCLCCLYSQVYYRVNVLQQNYEGHCSQPCHPGTSELMIWQVDFTCRPPPKWPWTESSCSPSKKEIKHSSLVLSVSGGLANEAKMFYKYLASCLVTIFLHTIYLGYALIWHNLSFNFAQPFSAFKALALTMDTKTPLLSYLVISELHCSWVLNA